MSAQKASSGAKSRKPSGSGKQSPGKTGSGKAGSAAAKHVKSSRQEPSPERAPILDTRLKRELVGVFIAVLAIALFIMIVAPGTAIISRGVCAATRHLVGLGAYVLPLLLLVWAASFFTPQGIGASALRLGIGLTLIFIALLGIAGVLSPAASTNAALIFKSETLMAHGGYVGGALAWALLRLVGEAIAFVILIGIIVAGIVLIGFSITAVVARVRDMFVRHPKDEWAEESLGAYDLTGEREDAAGRKGRVGKGKLIPATAQMGGAGAVAPTKILSDPSQAKQGRLSLEELDDTDDRGNLGNLGSTRRLAASMNNLDDEGTDKVAGDITVLLGKKASKASSGVAATVRTASTGATPMESDDFELPSAKLLKVSPARALNRAGESELRQTATELQSTIDEFGVDARVEGWVAGPTVTLFKISLGEGVRLTKINSLADDIALALAAPAVRIFSPIPGTTLVGIEVPNISRSTVLLGDVLPAALDGVLQLAVGKDVEGDSIVANLEKMPHLLIGGTTGSGKSVAINTMIMSILMRATPAQVRMILIDPKMVELSLYNDIPHLYVPVVTDAQKAAAALAWGVLEMERRLKIFQQAGSKNIAQYNEYVRKELAKAAEAEKKAVEKAAPEEDYVLLDEAENPEGDESATTDFAQKTSATSPRATYGEDELAEMPLIVIVIDELADLMMAAGKEVEISISRIAQLARAAGLHLIIATQRPSTNVITGLIKANIVNRIAFNVASGIDSRVILDTPGAEKLIGLGDLLFSRPEYGKPQRIQGCYVSEPEIEAVVAFLKKQGVPEYHEDILATAVGGVSTYSAGGGDGGDDDPLVWEAAEIVVSSQMGSTSTLQRRLKVGYARAGRIMDMLEQKGIVGPPSGSKPREVLIDDVLDLESLRALEGADDDW